MSLTSFDLSDGAEPMSHAEIEFLKQLAAGLLENPLIVNIGAADGVSTVAMLEERPDSFIFSVDTGDCPQEFANLKAAGLDTAKVSRVLGRSQEVGLNFPHEADMVFVDGGHRYDDVAGDIRVWLPKVKLGGIIAFHDYVEEPPANNVTEAWDAVNDSVLVQRPYEQLGVVDRIIAFRIAVWE